MQLAIYQQAKQALAEYKTVDEVKEFRDKAVAVEAYAKQANDYELEHDAALARVRAERKCGELLRDMEKAKGTDRGGRTSKIDGRRELPSNSPKTLSEMGVTKDQSSKWQKLANIPDDEFEEAVTMAGAKPSTNHLLKEKESQKSDAVKEEVKRMDQTALWLWGLLTKMDRDKVFDTSLKDLEDEWTDGMKQKAIGLTTKLREWVNE